MFLRPEKNEKFEIEWTVISAPNFYANPKEDGVDNENFSIINFSQKIIIIGGTGYTGEIKKEFFCFKFYFTCSEKCVTNALQCKLRREW